MTFLNLIKAPRWLWVSVTVFAMAYTTSALAVGTASGTDITNRATVNYDVSTIPQTLIESAPGVGNSTPGAGLGTNTVFEVDNLVDLTVTEVGGTHTRSPSRWMAEFPMHRRRSCLWRTAKATNGQPKRRITHTSAGSC